MMLLGLLYRRARLVLACALFVVAEGAKLAGDRILDSLEAELGLSRPKPFRWADYRPDKGDEP